MNTAGNLVDNMADFDMTQGSISGPEQSHGVKNMSVEEAMIAKITHPPTVVPELEGLCTMDARTQTISNYRNNDVLQFPLVMNDDGQTQHMDWGEVHDYSIIVPNGARIKYFGVTYAKTSSPIYEQDYRNVQVQDNFNFDLWRDTVNLYRPIYQSVTLYPNVTAFNNQGIINAQQFNPNVLFAGKISQLSHENTKLFHDYLDSMIKRKRVKLTKEISSTDPEINYSAVTSYLLSRGYREQGIELDPATSIQVIDLQNIGYPDDKYSLAPTPSQIMTNSMRSYADKFVSGAFAVNRINTLSPAWMAGDNTMPGSTSPTTLPGLYECYMYTISNDGGTHFVPLADKYGDVGAEVSNLPIMRDTMWSKDMTWTVIRMQGIQANEQSASTAAAGSPIAVKYYYGFEAQPVWNGPWNGVSRMAPKPSLNGMQNLLDIFFEMPDAMPMKYNSWGAFLPFLADVIPKGLGIISNIISKKKSAAPTVTEDKPKKAIKQDIKLDKRVAKSDKKVVRKDNELLKKISQLESKLAKVQVKQPRRRRKGVPLDRFLKKAGKL